MKTVSYYRLMAMLSCLISLTALADDKVVSEQEDRRIQEIQLQKQQPPMTPISPPPVATPSHQDGQSISLSASELGQYPELVVRALLAALIQNRGDDVAFLLPYYQNIPSQMQDDLIKAWATGLALETKADFKGAVRAYRSALSYNNQASLVRMRLATALFANKEYEASQDQFTKLLSEKDIPPEAVTYIQRYLTAIQQKDRLSITGGMNFLHDKNINNAPKNANLGGGWTAAEQESAHGIAINGGVSKKWTHSDGFYSQGGVDVSGKYYWDNKPYNELSTRLSVGVGHENARHEFDLSPFIEKTYYAGGKKGNNNIKPFSQSTGVSAWWRYWLTPNWQVSLNGEVAKQDYRTRTHLNGMTRQAGVNLVHLPNAKQYYFAGMDFHRTDAKDGDDSFVRRGFRVGMGQELGLGFSTRISANYANKDYRASGFFGQIQHNKEYGVRASVWHKKIHFAGMTPRLTLSHQQVRSNIPLYNYQKNQLFIEMSRQF